jgi:quinolinate synthase
MNEAVVEKIRELKEKRNAVILAHNYQIGEVQDLADFAGDSLDLARRAAETDAEVVIFCGVHFMAETSAILSPDKIVILPDPAAGCPMADMADAESVRRMKAKYPGAKVVCYVNSTAEVKAESDLCCTSANAVDMVSSVDGEIIFVPDRYLAAFAASRTGRKMHFWPGYCPTHQRILPYDIEEGRRRHPGCVVMVHPESRPEVTDLAYQVLSTGGMVRFARESHATTFVVGTETGLLHRLRKENPGKTFLPATDAALCPTMKMNTPEKILRALETLEPRITVPEPVRDRALAALLPLLKR